MGFGFCKDSLATNSIPGWYNFGPYSDDLVIDIKMEGKVCQQKKFI